MPGRTSGATCLIAKPDEYGLGGAIEHRHPVHALFRQQPCHFPTGIYKLVEAGLANQGVVPGLELTLPAGWSSTENNAGELNLIPPAQPDGRLFFWLDMVALKSSGPEHGTTILYDVGKTPDALVSWLTSNPDFRTIAKPMPATIGEGITMTTLVVGVSRSARYGDPECPANPRCADFFTRTGYWGTNSYGIGGEEEVRLYLGTIRLGGETHTFLVGLDAVSHAGLRRLEDATKSILDSVRLPN
jgi:hypothetical protein